MYRFERVLRGLLRVRVVRQRRWSKHPVPATPADVLGDVEAAGSLLGVLEDDGHLDRAALDAFEGLLRGAVRDVMERTAIVPTVFNGMARVLLHNRNYANRRDGMVARGIHAAALLAVEERLIVAFTVEVARIAGMEHATFPGDLDLGDRGHLRKPSSPDAANDDGPGGMLDAAE